MINATSDEERGIYIPRVFLAKIVKEPKKQLRELNKRYSHIIVYKINGTIFSNTY